MVQLASLLILTLQSMAGQVKKEGQTKKITVFGIDTNYVLQKLNYLTTDFTLYGQRFLEDKTERKEKEEKISEKMGSIDTKIKAYQKETTDKLSSMDGALKGLQNTVSALTIKLTDEMKRTHNMTRKMLKMEAEIELLKSHDRSKTGTVSFSSYMTPSLKTSSYQIIPFKGILTNEGGAYNPSTGIFTVPLNGLYYFHCSILTTIQGEYMLYVNGKRQMYLISDDKDIFEQSSNAVTLNLKKGDRVFITTASKRGNNFSYLHHYWSSFSGFLIKAE
ncbi:hypothetical protein FSP39_004300 [Pinctada imbricata]|uniref:C1q domain-containing protein n=1 Tax=Pinctada imbricata TaxID=66713 RepID=A0AA88XUA6_PINIB|nr:hypothetical protein FSP39_004300 [Pinctada imbricata]